MPRARSILDALRVAALWLLVVSVFFGPAGLGGSAAFASANKTCGVSCPCNEATHDDPANHHDNPAQAAPCDDDVAADSEHGNNGGPCNGDCPDDCPNCGCCQGIAMAVLPLPATLSRATSTSVRIPAPIDASAAGTVSGVFRPPRSLI